MTLERISLLRNIGQFDSVSAGNQLSLSRLSLIYAENGRGKTTIAAILRSLHSGDPILVAERRRLGATSPPHIVLTIAGRPIVFENDAWTAPLPRIAVFDDAFVAANVCSGISIDTAHRQNLHELILGAQGVTLNATLQGHVARIEQHNRELRTKGDAIPVTARGSLSVDAFCALIPIQHIDTKVREAERNLAAAHSANAIQQRRDFLPFSIPKFDTATINGVLERSLPALEAVAASEVREHLRSLGKGGETWVGDGVSRIASASIGLDHKICPFCAQDIAGSSIVLHYQAYFSEGYDALKSAIIEVGQGINTTHGGDIPAAFERAVRVATENREFWRAFTDIPDITIDTAAISRAWAKARDAVLAILRAKATAPLERMVLPAETLAAIEAYEAHRLEISDVSAALEARSAAIALVKERATAANISTLEADLHKLLATKARHEPSVAALCAAHLDEKAAKAVTEGLREQIRTDLDRYRRTVFPAYETAINEYLRRFNAGFRITSVASVNNRGGSSANYNVLINNVPVLLMVQTGPSFKNTLSAGDRNTLALAFFFASLEQDPYLEQKIVVIDDPMTSLDEHRSLTTVQEMYRLCGRVSQMLVLSHSKPFLCAIWESADKAARCAIRIGRDGQGSTLALWDVNRDSITEHDRRHEQVREYIRVGNSALDRTVAAALRPILEVFIRVAYPSDFPPGKLLGPFIGVCEQRHGGSSEILSLADTAELRALLTYANRFHHDTNPAWETAAINDQELCDFARRTLAFARRR